MSQSKVKSHSRRTQSGTTRVRESRRKNKKSLGKKIAIAGAAGVGLVGLGLVINRLKNSKGFTIEHKQNRVRPKMDGPVTKETGKWSSMTANKNHLKNSRAVLEDAKWRKKLK